MEWSTADAIQQRYEGRKSVTFIYVCFVKNVKELYMLEKSKEIYISEENRCFRRRDFSPKHIYNVYAKI